MSTAPRPDLERIEADWNENPHLREFFPEVPALLAYVRRLEGEVVKAYREGWVDHRDASAHFEACWDESCARAALPEEESP